MSGERGAALQAAMVIFSKRCCGMAPSGEVAYFGGFDVRQVANSADLPRDSSEREHRIAWKKFRTLFDQEYQHYLVSH